MSGNSPVTARLKDGTRVRVRPAEPSDAAALKAGFRDLSQHSRIMRFLRDEPQMPEGDVSRFVSPDHTLHEALGAVVLAPSDHIPAGIAHFFRPTVASDRAELALTVIDRFQGQGIGTLLLGRLLRAAAELRIKTLDAIVHPKNQAMAGLLSKLGATAISDSGERAFVLPIHADPSDYPDNRLGNAIRAAWHLTPDRAVA